MLDVSTRYSHGTQRNRKTRALDDPSITRAEDRKDGNQQTEDIYLIGNRRK